MPRPDIRVLTVRDPHPGGTTPATAVTAVSGDFSAALRQLVVFVHGYNNTAADAAESYERFLGLSQIADEGAFGPVCLLHWPGNHRWGLFSFAAYLLEHPKAQASAKKLYAFLAGLPRFSEALQVRLVCHSLGCRLALHLLEEAAKDPNPNKPRFSTCLMAAAAPVRAVSDGGQFNGAARGFEKSLVLYSGSDWVLGYVFPLGEMVAGGGWFPTAVGKRGDPATGLWTAQGDMGAHGYGHGDYWPGRESAQAVDRFFEPANERALPQHATPAAPPIEAAIIAARPIRDREIGVSWSAAFA